MTVPAVINHLYGYFPCSSPGLLLWTALISRVRQDVTTSVGGGARARSGCCTRETVHISCQISFSWSDMILTLDRTGEGRCKRKLADFPSVNGDCKIPLRRDLAWLGEDSASDGDSTAGLDNKIVSSSARTDRSAQHHYAIIGSRNLPTIGFKSRLRSMKISSRIFSKYRFMIGNIQPFFC